MNLSEEDIKRKEFKAILQELSRNLSVLKNGKDRSQYIQRLEKLYYLDKDNRFKHFYSDIYVIMSKNDSNSDNGDNMALSRNVERLRAGYQVRNRDANGNLIDISESLKKLHDHVNLESARFGSINAQISKSPESVSIMKIDEAYSKASSAQSMIETLEGNVSKVSEKFNTIEKEMEKSKDQYITILGIFSSVVISFTAGTAFSMSVLENISQASIYRIVLIVLALGLILLNAIFALFYYIGVLTGKNISYKPIKISSGILGVLILLTVVAWLCGVVEKRDKKFENILDDSQQVIEEVVEYTEKQRKFFF